MAGTLHRPPAEGATPQEHDFLHGIDLDREHRRPRRIDPRWLVAAIAVLAILAALVIAVLVTGESTSPDALYDSGHRPIVPEAAPSVRLTPPNRAPGTT
jgi:hypothetical protein